MRRELWILTLLTVLLAAGGPVVSANETAPETVVVRRGPLGSAVDVKGVLVPAHKEAVAIKLKAWKGSLEIVEAASEGRVVEGQPLVRFKDDDLERHVESTRLSLESSRLKLQRMEREAAIKAEERTYEMDTAVRSKRIADEKLEQFVTVERKLRETEAIHRMEGRKISLKNQLEELQQLEKMYGEDDLTEETEEIVLRRARRSYERSLKSYEFSKQRHDWFMTQTLPRELESLKLSVRKATNKHERLKTTQPLDIQKEKISLESTRLSLVGLEKSYAHLKADLEALTVKAPMAGYAVPGHFHGGKWSGLESGAAMLEPGKKVKPGTHLFTIVDPDSLGVDTAVKEANLRHVKAGLPATVTTALTGKAKLEAKVDSVARYGSGGSYKVRVLLREKNERLRTGLGCKVKITKEAPDEVLSVPVKSILEDDGSHYVFVLGDDGPEQVEVRVGRKADGRREITEGLKAGQRILKSPPEELEEEEEHDDDHDNDEKKK